MITRATVICLGLSQLVVWGISYYQVGVFGEQIAATHGWNLSYVHGGFSIALLVMGLTSPVIGRAIERHGGRPVMTAGSLTLAIGCVGVALAENLLAYYVAWVVMGVAMRLCLYDAAFAALARIGGPDAKRPIAQITLLGGLASTVFWPIGHTLAEWFGWQGAVLCYAGIALLTIPLHLAIPTAKYQAATASEDGAPPPAPKATNLVAAWLYAVIVMLTTFLNSAMSAHMIGILAGLGIGAGTAVWISTLRGIGQSSARLGEVIFGRFWSPLTLALGASALLPICFILGLFSAEVVAAGIGFALFYGAGNGLLTIARGTLPLALFEPSVYGSLVGRLLVPSFLLAAVAPFAYALVIEFLGDAAALWLSFVVGAVILACAIILRARFR